MVVLVVAVAEPLTKAATSTVVFLLLLMNRFLFLNLGHDLELLW